MSRHVVHLELGHGERRALTIDVPEHVWHGDRWAHGTIRAIDRQDEPAIPDHTRVTASAHLCTQPNDHQEV